VGVYSALSSSPCGKFSSQQSNIASRGMLLRAEFIKKKKRREEKRKEKKEREKE